LGAKTKEVGGGPAVGLAEDTITGLRALLNPQRTNTGGLGTAGSPDAFGSAGGAFGILAQLLSPGAGNVGGSYAKLINKQQERDVNAIRSRFGASGGAAFGTPAAFAENQYRAEAAPQVATQIGKLQLEALMPLLQGAFGLSQSGIAPRQLVQQKSGLGQALGTFAKIGGAALPFLAPGIGAPAGAALSAAGSSMSADRLSPGYQFGSGYQPRGFYE
jgi:hypothetical protein